ncbi:hypothetical protein [Moritella viscosa]|uniref:Pilin accessory protein (PilO) n=1 Tax=Moritella viscosa TaxID=80854 RepID=A0ABY1HLI8_9GAMM|nr:hypothetical protein [Moritella viscosa]SGZ00294.1 Putative uncharacterized protein [Moritella viscosa]
MTDITIAPPLGVMPSFIQGSTKHTSKSKLRKNNNGPYNLTFVARGWVCHYTSAAPSFAYGHAWLKAISNRYTSIKSWCLLQEIDEPGQLYFIWVKDGVVEEAKKCTANAINSMAIQRVDIVYLIATDITGLTALVGDAKTQKIKALTTDELKGFALKKTQKIDVRLLILLVIVIASLGTFVLFKQDKQVVKQVAAIDPLQAYSAEVDQSLSASVAINNAVTLAAYGALAPNGWTFKNVRLQGDRLLLNIAREANGSRQIITAWINSHPVLETLSAISTKAAVINMPLPRGLSYWERRTLSIGALTNNIIDAAVMQGWHIDSDAVTTQRNVELSTLRLTKANATLSELRSFAYLLTPLPARITELSLQRESSFAVVNASLTIEFIGVK